MIEKERMWRAHLAAFRTSGGTRRAFCVRRHLPLSSFYYWQKRLRIEPADVESMSMTAPRLIPIEVMPSREARYEIRLPGGKELIISDGFDVSAVRALIDVLDARRC